MSTMINLIGQKFGKLTVIKRKGKNKWGNYKWLCRCDCGNKIITNGGSLKSGNTQSCGCLQKEIVTKHGHSTRTIRSKTYMVLNHIIQRCTNHNDKEYSNYGDRGITVCNRWKNSFSNFLEDMGESPPGCQIDRIDNNKGYYKENCRWVTPKQNSRNKRNSRYETYKGKTQLLTEWAEEYGIVYNILWNRFCKYGWSIEKALTTPIKKRKRKK